MPASFTPGKLILAEPLNETPPIVLAVSNAEAVLALPINAPRKLVASKSPFVPLNTSLVLVASGTNVKYPVESS